MKGTQTEVLKAVLRGRVTAYDIALSLGMPVNRVYTPLRRLKDAGHIRASKRRGKRSYKAYSVVNPCGFMLADIWGASYAQGGLVLSSRTSKNVFTNAMARVAPEKTDTRPVLPSRPVVGALTGKL